MLGAPVRWPRPSRLGDPLDVPQGKLAKGLEALGLTSVGALLAHLPRDSREARTVAGLREGEQATVAVQVRKIGTRPVRRRGMKPLVEATVFDEMGSMRATFFNQPWLAQRYEPGTRLVLHGKTTARGTFNVAHHAVGSDSTSNPLHPTPGETDTPGEIAHYPATEGVSSTQILTLVQGVRDALADVPEALSAATRVSEQLPDRSSALAAMHFPHGTEDREAGRRRLAFEELLLTQLLFLRRRAKRRASTSAHRLSEPPGLSERWLKEGLPFELTGDQRRAVATIGEELATGRAMQRLLMGEVGSGKTVVALYAMLRAVEHGCQGALMAPTETLAEQHFATVQRLIGAEPVPAALLSGATPARRRAGHSGQARQWRAGADRRHPRVDRAGRPLPGAGGRGHRRAASLRRAPAGGAGRQGSRGGGWRADGPARAAHDSDADPAHARARAVRGPGREHSARAAARTAGDRDADRGGRARA